MRLRWRVQLRVTQEGRSASYVQLGFVLLFAPVGVRRPA